jgi:hypothetical protein
VLGVGHMKLPPVELKDVELPGEVTR